MQRITGTAGFIIVMFLSSFFISCEKTNDSGEVIFYTHAQFLVNCGQWDVHIFIDGQEAGILSQPHLPLDDTPSCSASGTPDVLIKSKEPGFYHCKATFDCSSIPDWNSSFEIKPDSCSRVFIPLGSV